ncbi:unnamed protein product [Triticum turgidum subsp. durum]|uniref:F-box domain-containing protein n=1 Tax=Triticum turgidum subsp. durum TaxID=4567 RepID=A0A9R0ZM87_TRITD|nr:unnamed protein product [Triticum turgidum subsp. durum]
MSTPVDRARPWEDGLKSTRIRSSSPPPSGSETAAERLTDDLLVEILSRVPGRSLCRFKCVSKHWLGLINDRTYRRKFPRTLTGFFFSSTTEEQLVHPVLPFTNLSGSRSSTSLTFLPNGRNAFLLDCCNGLLLYDVSSHLGKRRYVVCNPATGEWTELPHCDHAGWVGIVHLGFDPAVSPHFYVFLLTDQLNGFGLPGVDVCSYVYSSETERWVHQEKKWYWDIDLVRVHSAAYLNGCLHFFAEVNHNTLCLAADKEAGTMIYSHVPPLNDGFMQQSQGCLYYAGFGRDDNDDHVVRLLVYVLEDYNNKEWILKHSIESSHLLGGRHDVDIEEDFCWIAIHPECNLIFCTLGWDRTFMCYDMDRRQLKVICNLENGAPSYLPYVPLYEELQSLHK